MGKWRDSKPSQMDSQRALLGEAGRQTRLIAGAFAYRGAEL